MQRLLETTQHPTCEGPGQVKIYNSYEATWKGVKASLHSRLAHIILIVQWRSYFMEISRGLGFFFFPLNEHQRDIAGALLLLQDPFLPSTCSPSNCTLPWPNPEQNWRQVLVQVCFPDCGRETSSLQWWLMLNVSISIAVSALSRQQFRGHCAPLSIRATTSWLNSPPETQGGACRWENKEWQKRTPHRGTYQKGCDSIHLNVHKREILVSS